MKRKSTLMIVTNIIMTVMIIELSSGSDNHYSYIISVQHYVKRMTNESMYERMYEQIKVCLDKSNKNCLNGLQEMNGRMEGIAYMSSISKYKTFKLT